MLRLLAKLEGRPESYAEGPKNNDPYFYSYDIRKVLEYYVKRYGYSQFLHYQLVSSLQKVNIGNTGNQNHPEFKVRVVLVTCISNIDNS